MKYIVETVKDNGSGRIRARVELDKERHKNILETESSETRNKVFGAFINFDLFPTKFKEIEFTAQSREESLLEVQQVKENTQQTIETAPETQATQ
jgi:hypothetical protein